MPYIKKAKSFWRRKFVLSALLLLMAYCLLVALLPAPKPTVHLTVQSGAVATGTASEMPWPPIGNLAIATADTDILVARNADHQSPMASTSKVILALAILRKYPLQPGQTGPTITLTAKDEGFYQAEVARNGSSVPVTAGTQITQSQALQALLLASGNNIASTLASWAFGSGADYITYATNMLRDMGLDKTNLDDVSGYSPRTVSTPRELVKIAKEAMKQPVFAKIVSQKTANLPIVGAVQSTNTALGLSGINGIKTGHTDESGGCLLFSATRQVDGREITLIGAMQAVTTIGTALATAPELVEVAYQNMTYVTSAMPSQAVGTVTVPWAQPIQVLPQKEVSQLVWKGNSLQYTVTTEPIKDTRVGQLQVGDQKTDLLLATPLGTPDFLWRFTHPLQLLGWAK